MIIYTKFKRALYYGINTKYKRALYNGSIVISKITSVGSNPTALVIFF